MFVSLNINTSLSFYSSLKDKHFFCSAIANAG